MSKIAAVIGVIGAIAVFASVATLGAAPTAAASPVWRGTAWLNKEDGDSGGITTGLQAYKCHDEGNHAVAGFAAPGEHLEVYNRVSDSDVTVCVIVRVYTIEGQFLDDNAVCRSGYGNNSVN